jgi:CBS domain-containing protein
MLTVGVGSEEIDIKKAGVFPIVHGVRALAIEKAVPAQSTAARVEALAGAGALEPELGRELVSALRVFMEFRLRSQLAAVRRGSIAGESLVHPSRLSAGDRDILRDSLRIVRRFREMIRRRFNTGTF